MTASPTGVPTAPADGPLDVFLIPVGAARYEPYCEVPDEDPPTDAPADHGWWDRVQARVRTLLSAVERERTQASPHVEQPRTWLGRLEARMRRWMAERVAEQRLLWRLRRCPEARLVFPADLEKPAAMHALRAALTRDAARHRRWLLVDSGLLALTGILTLIPGPNLLFWFFLVRVGMHYMSWRGARHGLDATHWYAEPDQALVDLRQALSLAPDERERRVEAVARRLQLPHLARFFERIALRSA